MKIKIDRKTEEKLKKDLEAVKGKIVKRGQIPMNKSLRDFLAENHLLPLNEDRIGGKGESGLIIDSLFQKQIEKKGSDRKAYRGSTCLGSYYQACSPEYWNIMRKYLRRFLCIHSYHRTWEHTGKYDFGPWEYPRPENYPKPEEKRALFKKRWDFLDSKFNDIEKGEVFEKFWDLSFGRLNQREKSVLEVMLKEQKEYTGERIFQTLSAVADQFGWTLPDPFFKYEALFDPYLKEFWEEVGLNVNENFAFFCSPYAYHYYFIKPQWRESRIAKYSLFDLQPHTDYTLLKKHLINNVGISKGFFDRLERIYISIQLQDWIPILSRVVRPLFLIAHFLKRDDSTVYNFQWKRIKYYLSSFKDQYPKYMKHILAREIRELLDKDFLFKAVWQDYLFDSKKYLQKPKVSKGERGRPPDFSTSWFVLNTVDELKRLKSRFTESPYLITAKFFNFLTREERFNIMKKHKFSYHNLGAENVRQIYYRAKKLFSQKDMRIKIDKEK